MVVSRAANSDTFKVTTPADLELAELILRS